VPKTPVKTLTAASDNEEKADVAGSAAEVGRKTNNVRYLPEKTFQASAVAPSNVGKITTRYRPWAEGP